MLLTRLGPLSLPEERSEIPIVLLFPLCCRLPPKLRETAKVYRLDSIWTMLWTSITLHRLRQPARFTDVPVGRRMSSLKFNFHTVCIDCRGVDCDLETRCIECTDVSDMAMSNYVSHKLSLKKKLFAKCKLKALSPLPVRGQEVESVDDGHRPGRSLLVPAHAVTGRGLLTATGRGVEETSLVVTGRGQFTATGRAISERIPLPAGEIGVTARGHTLSRVALVTARDHAGDNLPLLPARWQKSQDGWPDEKRRRVLRRLPLSHLLFLKRR